MRGQALAHKSSLLLIRRDTSGSSVSMLTSVFRTNSRDRSRSCEKNLRVIWPMVMKSRGALIINNAGYAVEAGILIDSCDSSGRAEDVGRSATSMSQSQ